ncbi:MAG TPA: hypothetical protein VK939_17555 [Longimicrobiales bacterium]|nr:hypothetical protein [Longimicrobiales bacterium]
MSEWFYIWLAFGLTWVVVGGYAWRLRGRQVAAERGLGQNGGVR